MDTLVTDPLAVYTTALMLLPILVLAVGVMAYAARTARHEVRAGDCAHREEGVQALPGAVCPRCPGGARHGRR